MYFKENLRIVVCLLIITMLLNNVHDWLQSFPLPLYTPSAIYICLVYFYLPDLDLCLGQWNVVERVEPSLKGDSPCLSLYLLYYHEKSLSWGIAAS